MPEIVMYILINKELRALMKNKGKIAAQAAHSAVKASHYAQNEDQYKVWWLKWFKGSYPKIVVKASRYEMEQLMNKYPNVLAYTKDEGRTVIPKGSLTSIAFFPMPKDKVPEELQGLKLL